MSSEHPDFTEAEFATWIPIPEAYKLLQGHLDEYVARRELCENLEHGLVLSRAESMAMHGKTPVPFVLVPQSAWKTIPQDYNPFWQTGTLKAEFGHHTPSHAQFMFFRIRVNPEGLGKLMPAKAVQASPSPAPEAPTPAEKKNLPSGEYEKVSRALVAGWGTALTEDQAWARAKLIFPDHNVRKREFLAEYRRERGPKNPGKPSSRQEV